MQRKLRFDLMKVLGGFIVLFGLASLASGGRVLMDDAARSAAGNVIPLIVYFNVLVSPMYLFAGFAIWKRKSYARTLSVVLLAAYLAAFAYLLFHVQGGGAFEWRTVYAMVFRTAVWAGTAWALFRLVKSGNRANPTMG